MNDISDQQRKRILILLFFGVLMGALDIAIVGPALPVIQRSFAVDDRMISLVVAAYILFNLVGTPLMAKLADVIGHRTIYIADILIFAAGSLVVALASAFWVVLVGRARGSGRAASSRWRLRSSAIHSRPKSGVLLWA